MAKQSEVFILAAEASGDLLGAHLLSSLYQKQPGIIIEAVAGPRMRQHPCLKFLRSEEFYVMGFLDVIKALPKLIKLYKKVLSYLLKHPPKILILIDYPGFNLRLAKDLKERGCTSLIIQYVCPTVWAWKKKRILTMEKGLDHLFCLYPFELKCFHHSSLKVSYVGHPLCDNLTLKQSVVKKNSLLICPGSRLSVVKRNFPLQLAAASKALNSLSNERITILCASETIYSYITHVTKNLGICDKIDYTYNRNEAFDHALLAIATSGTVNLELALHRVPTIVTYNLSLLDAFLAKCIFKLSLPFYCLVNILCQKEIFPEYYGPFLNSKELLKKILSLIPSIDIYREQTLEVSKTFNDGNKICPASWILEKLDHQK